MADIWHNFPTFMLEFFNQMVTRPFEDHPETPSWRTEVLNMYVTHHTNTILQRGTVNFEDGYNGLTPDDLMLIYCYYMMQKHTSCSYRVLDVSRQLIGDTPASADRIVTVDFGCGPATWAVAMAWFYLSQGVQPPADRIRLRYIGVDQSPAAMRRATSMLACPLLFHQDHLLAFFDSYEASTLCDRIGEFIPTHVAEPLIVLNFAFFFASPTINVLTIAAIVRTILERYRQHKICLIFQNPTDTGLSTKWEEFKAMVPGLHVIWMSSGPWHDRVHYNDTTGRRRFSGHSSRLYFQVLANRPSPDLLGVIPR